MTINNQKYVALTDAEQHELLGIARRTLELYFQTHKQPVLATKSSSLLQPAGAFVTLHIANQLRGCIGTFEARGTLLDTVSQMAIAAAFSDPRFPSLTVDELPLVHIEISVLSPKFIINANDVVVGEHGLEISRVYQRGVLLPQVATEHGWDKETFLAHTCIKAGLPSDSWKQPETTIKAFTAQVFGEEKKD